MAELKQLPFAGVQVFDSDEDDLELDDLDSIPSIDPEMAPARRRGRPKGSRGRVSEDHDLTLSDFSYLRAVVQGIDPKKAALRYLFGKVYLNRSACADYENRLRSIMQRTIKVLLDEADKKKAEVALNVLAAPTLHAVALGPSLAKFAERFDSDMYSEAELQELYMEEFGATMDQTQHAESMANGYAIKTKLNAITWLSEHIARKPAPSNPIELWLDIGLVPKLRAHGVITMADLMDWVNLQGRSFYHRIKGFGITRARRLALWLMDNEEHIGKRLDRRIRFQSWTPDTVLDIIDVHPVGESVATVQEYRIVPLELLAWPVALLGHEGIFRSQGPNTLGVNNDKEAIQAWLDTLTATASTATQISYQRAVERLVLWSIVERRTALSSLVTEHFVQFREFLRNPPAHWVSRFPTVRGSPDWRPLRGAMKEVSIQQTFSAISALFSALNASGYLMANAVSSVRTSVKRDLRMDVMRSFSEEDLLSIGRTMAEMEDGPHKRRLRAIILLLQTGGFRRGEAVGLRYCNLEQLRQDNRITDMWVARFIGKGGKERQVPIQLATFEALQDHYRDRLALIEGGKEVVVGDVTTKSKPSLAAYAGMSKGDTPLLSILDDRFAKGRAATSGEAPGNSRIEANLDGALSYGRLHSLLKAFFLKVEQRVDLPSGSANFKKASTHWLRHTFGLQAMIASNGDLASIQQILGHADIATTGIYTKADMKSRVSVVNGIKGAV